MHVCQTCRHRIDQQSDQFRLLDPDRRQTRHPWPCGRLDGGVDPFDPFRTLDYTVEDEEEL